MLTARRRAHLMDSNVAVALSPFHDDLVFWGAITDRPPQSSDGLVPAEGQVARSRAIHAVLAILLGLRPRNLS